ncbi:MAG: glycosyltransferase [Candidatus Aureabacteria bacterium]|nr:glycosyltransferase [Candidatus Auribacterota bacterium]
MPRLLTHAARLVLRFTPRWRRATGGESGRGGSGVVVRAATRILYVIINMEIGGAERQLAELVTRLSPECFAPHVVCLKGRGPLLEKIVRKNIPHTLYNFPPLDFTRKIRTSLSLLREIRELRRVMKAFNPHIVHAVLPQPCVVAGIAAKIAGVPVLVTSRRSLGCYKEGRFLLRQMENLVNLWADAVVANSEAVKADTLARERINERTLRVIYNGVVIPARREGIGWPEIAGREIAGPVVCCVANFFPYKGHQELVAAADQVVKEIPEATFIFVGDGKLRPQIEQWIEERNLRSRILLLGSREDSTQIMLLSDLVVLASHQEGFPNVLLEAMAVGKPVVATCVGGVPEIVEDRRTGFLVPPKDPERLAAAIIDMLQRPQEVREMGLRGLERVRDLFSVEKMVQSYEDLYLSLLREKGGIA